VWAPAERSVVVGISSRVDVEVDRAACEADGLAIVRRGSGGATVLVTPEVVCFSLCFAHERFGDAATIGGAYRRAVVVLAEAFGALGIATGFERPCDLTVGERKLVGMAQSRKRSASLVHGVVPVALAIDDVEQYLRHPAEEPRYRAGRSHHEFMTTVGLLKPGTSVANVASALENAFSSARLSRLEASADELDAARDLVDRRYGDPAWTYRR
jgi:lipoate-protein ligase A